MNLSSITNTALGLAGQAAGLGFKAVQGGLQRVSRLRGSDDSYGEARFSPTATPARPEPAAKAPPEPAEKAPPKPKATKPAAAKEGRFVREVSDPKRARKLRERSGGAAAKAGATAATGPAKVEGAEGHGGRPAGVQAENTPSERAASGKGRQAAPMGSTDDTEDSA